MNYQFKPQKEFLYEFSFQDKKGNEIESKIYNCYNKKNAVKMAFNILGNLSNNEIVKIKTKRWL